MFSFYAYFWNSDVYINEKYKYAAGEILTAYLNTDYFKFIDDDNLIDELKKLKRKLYISEEMDYEDYENYNQNVHSAEAIIARINEWLEVLPPYNKTLKYPLLTLEDLLNKHTFLFEDALNTEERENISWETFSEYGNGEVDENGFRHFRLHKFVLHSSERIADFDRDMLDLLNEFNAEIRKLFSGYIEFLESYMTVHNVFKPFVNSYLHRKETFLNSNELAKCFDDFNKEHSKNFHKIKCRMNSFGYNSLQDEKGKLILCEEIAFDDLQSFLYYDFFNGIKKNYIPKQCKNCGRYFLIQGGKYLNYCNTPLKNEPNKTCRDVGSKRRYDDKCKNDPIWQTYNRAYKAHYARYMKKKMTVSQFEQWSRFASEIRDKALREEIPYEQYYVEIRKK